MAMRNATTVLLFILLTVTEVVLGQGNLNLTVTFYPDSGDSCNDTSSGITFTTQSVPYTRECFNLADLFTGNTTFGFRNQAPDSDVYYYPDPLGVYWRIENVDAYDPKANYSNVHYLQPVMNDNDDEGEGTDASRYLSVWSGSDCQATGSPSTPWFGWTCSSSEQGECNALPYSVASFTVDNASEINERDGKCWTFAYQGSATGNLVHLKGGLAAVVSLATIFVVLA